MNWSRGLLRAWMVFTVLWFIFMGLIAYNTWPQRRWWEQNAIQQSESGKTDYFAKITGIKSTETPKTSAEIDVEYQKSVRENLVMALAMASGLPAFLFAIGWAVLWIGRGFRKT